jgi:hypothetical protein
LREFLGPQYLCTILLTHTSVQPSDHIEIFPVLLRRLFVDTSVVFLYSVV